MSGPIAATIRRWLAGARRSVRLRVVLVAGAIATLLPALLPNSALAGVQASQIRFCSSRAWHVYIQGMNQYYQGVHQWFNIPDPCDVDWAGGGSGPRTSTGCAACWP